jgi:hypothetical protein
MLAQFQEMMTLHTVSNNLERYATMMMELPRKFDEALTQAYSQRLQHHGTPSAYSPRPSTTSAVVVALLLALAAVVLLSQHLVASGIAREWVEKGSAIVFVLLGALLLRAASRTR